MLCLCKQQVNNLAAALQPLLRIPPIALNVDLSALSLQLSALNSAAQLAGLAPGLLASLSAGLPPLALPASLQASLSVGLAARLGALGAGVQAVHAGLGLNLADPQADLMGLSASVALHAPLLNALVGALNAAINALKSLLPAATALQMGRALGVNLLGPHASIQLGGLASQALRLQASLRFPPLTPALSARLALAAVMQGAQSMGINLALPGGVASFTAALRLMAGLSIPPVLLNVPGLAPSSLGALSALGLLLAALEDALGLNLLQPGAAARLPALLAPLVSLKLPGLALPAPPPFNLALARPAAALNGQVTASMDLAGLAVALNLPMPSLGALPSLALSLSMIAKATGVNLAVSGSLPCPVCTVAKL